MPNSVTADVAQKRWVSPNGYGCAVTLLVYFGARDFVRRTDIEPADVRAGVPVSILVRCDRGPGEPVDGVRIEVSAPAATVIDAFRWVGVGEARGQMVFGTAGSAELTVRLWLNDTPLVERHTISVRPAD